jgi:hypothetical protein
VMHRPISARRGECPELPDAAAPVRADPVA